MSDANHPIPSPQPGDSDDVELALETSQRLYLNGDHAEALKWLRRAANSADEAGDDMRQLQLARAAADLTASVTSGPQVVTSAPSIPPTTTKSALPSPTPSRLPQPPSKQPPPAPSLRGSVAPGPTPPNKPSVMPSGSATPQPPSTSSGGPPPLPAKPKSTSSGGIGTTPAVRTESQPPPPNVSDSQPPPTANKPVSVSIKPKTSEPSVAPSASTKPSVSPTASSSATVAARPDKPNSGSISGFVDVSGAKGTVRVSVRISARDESLYIVRPLEPGQRLPAGSREARLVFEQDGS